MKRSAHPLPIAWLLLDGLAMACLALGVFGKVAKPGGAMAVLADPALHWSLIGVGGAGAALAAAMIIGSLRRDR